MLQRSKHMFDGASSQRHRLWLPIEPTLLLKQLGFVGADPASTGRPAFKLFDEGVDCANRIVCGDLVVQVLRQQCGLASVFALDESAHPRLLYAIRQL